MDKNKTMYLAIIIAVASIIGNVVTIFVNNSYATIKYVDKQIGRSDEITILRYTQITRDLTELKVSVKNINTKIYQIIKQGN